VLATYWHHLSCVHILIGSKRTDSTEVFRRPNRGLPPPLPSDGDHTASSLFPMNNFTFRDFEGVLKTRKMKGTIPTRAIGAGKVSNAMDASAPSHHRGIARSHEAKCRGELFCRFFVACWP
jgi:hypothetical protein